MRKFATLVVAVIMMATVLTGCQKDEFVQELTPKEDGLFLKSAQAGQTASVLYFFDGKVEKFYYPNNLLFEVTASSTAKVLNSFMLEVKDYHVSDNEAFFLVAQTGSKPVNMGEIGGKPIVDFNAENVSAVRLPFVVGDYGVQGNESAKFNGLLKADHYVLAVSVEAKKLMLYDLQTGKTVTTNKISVKDDVLSSDLGTLRFIKNSPVGNIFEFSTGQEKYAGYTLN